MIRLANCRLLSALHPIFLWHVSFVLSEGIWRADSTLTWSDERLLLFGDDRVNQDQRLLKASKLLKVPSILGKG